MLFAAASMCCCTNVTFSIFELQWKNVKRAQARYKGNMLKFYVAESFAILIFQHIYTRINTNEPKKEKNAHNDRH